MRTISRGILTLLMALIVHISFAQEKSISGNVTDQDGLPLPGVNILVQNTTRGTQTDFDGNYAIKATEGQSLVFSYIGYKDEILVVGASNTVNIQMSEDAQALDEVVVTALGIERSKKSLGYSVQEVSGEALSNSKEQSFISSLSGKVAGLDIKKSNSIGGSINVVLRGSSSLSNSNQALFVVDGIPISNTNYNDSSQATNSGGYDYGNAASDINPEDIASVSVLKGTTASALYGSDAANGVILITTKKGSKNKGLGITVSNTTSVSKVDFSTFPEYQFEYGAGYGAYYGSTGYFYDTDVDGDGIDDLLAPIGEDASFGGAYDENLTVYQWDNLYPQLEDTYLQPGSWTAPENGPSSIFQTGTSNVLNIFLDGGTEKSAFRFGYTNDDRSGILPNSKIRKDIITLSGTTDLSDKLKMTAKGTYSKTSGQGRYGTGYDSGNVVQMLRQWFQTNVDLEKQKQAYFSTGENITWNPNSADDLSPHYFDNPYYTLYENYETDTRTRFLGNANIDYKVTDWLTATGRIGADTYSDLVEERKNIGSVDQSYYRKINRRYEQYNYDFLLNINKQLNDDLTLTGLVGASLQDKKYNSTDAQTNGGLVIEGLWALSNTYSSLSAPSENDWQTRKVGLYAQASLGYKNMLYLDGTIRRDVSSTLPEDNNSYIYPSVSSSFIFSNVTNLDWLTFGKLRLSYAEVSNDAPVYSVNNTVSAADSFNSTPLYYISATSQNNDLKPESTTELEAGVEAKFLQNRLGLEVSLYKKNTIDQILSSQVSTATGFYYKWINAGEMENKGVEIALNATPIQNNDFQWNVNLNWAKNKNKVISLDGDSENLLLYSAWDVAINATKGEAYGTITGTDYQYYGDTNQRIVGSDGKYIDSDDSDEIIGNIQPDWIGGVYNNFKYKNFTFGFLIDMQKGGDIYSVDMGFGNATGLYKETAGNNELGNPIRDAVADGGGVLLNGVTADGTTNTTRADASDYTTPFGYYGGSSEGSGYAPSKQFVYDASYIKLREVSLGYDFPSRLMEKLPFTALTLSASARNLWIIHKNLPYGDPEYSSSSGNYRGIQNGSLPSTKDVSFNVTLKF
ncbi:SusC/RagA family TonB-linked outer membrane protein [Maribacter polysaccharolyticus]|uniref:SusC/RagA family TonB-linked outer membrane protein n=1 Tax=Maribacter polysaccharolyticus TaxID=3020831 RepID=UPI00237F3C2D|nr:SusC/RagA family TonB-linked outer membrane protein [Maribacter polysaccharolyticus]MDE3741562.1 SusC/RagA family TonB-linked outer membrane protein [Maribacter polysaccharolyticus]